VADVVRNASYNKRCMHVCRITRAADANVSDSQNWPKRRFINNIPVLPAWKRCDAQNDYSIHQQRS